MVTSRLCTRGRRNLVPQSIRSEGTGRPPRAKYGGVGPLFGPCAISPVTHTLAQLGPAQAQRFLTLHGITQNLFRVGRHLLQAVNYRLLRAQAFQVWRDVACSFPLLAFHPLYNACMTTRQI